MPGLRPRLVAASGLSESAAILLEEEALPLMVRALGTADTLGKSEDVWATCQRLYEAQANGSSTELTRTDNDWPRQRQQLAHALLGAGPMAAIAQRHAPTAPARATTVLGCLAVLLLATAGQQAAEHQLSAATLNNWLREQASLAQPLHPTVKAAAGGTGGTARPPAPPAAARWWPLAALATVGIGASVFFWQQQAPALDVVGTSTPAAIAAPATTQPGAVTPAATVAGQPQPSATPQPRATDTGAAPVSTKEEAPVSAAPPEVVLTAARTAAPAALPAAAEAAAAAPNLPAEASKPTGAMLRDTVGNAKLANRIGGHYNTDKGRYERDNGQPLMVSLPRHVTLMVGINSTESLLYKRLSNPAFATRQPADLDRLAFAVGKDKLDMEGAQQLGNVAHLLKTFPGNKLVVFGNAGPAEPQALTLALNRAQAAVNELVKQGIPRTSLQAQGRLRSSAENPKDADYSRRIALYISQLN